MGALFGWAGVTLLLLSLALMVREPRLARALGGWETMLRWHHRAGMAGYLLLLAHPLALAWAVEQSQPAQGWARLAPAQQGWSVDAGWAALLVLMAGLLATFSPRLAYRPWRATHQLLGLGVLAGLAHVAALRGHEGLALLAMAVAAGLLGWRIVVTDRGASALPYRVTQVAHPAGGAIEATLQPLAGALRPAPGQFVAARFLDSLDYQACGEFHPFTVSGIGADGSLRLAIKALGACSSRIQRIGPGVLVRLQGPFGSFLQQHAVSQPQLWVAGGIGITPFIAALRQRPCAQPTALVYVYRCEPEAAFLEELRLLQACTPRLQLITQATGAAKADLQGLLAQVEGLAQRQVHVCGPAALVDDLSPRLREQGVPAQAIHVERFDFRS